MKKVFSAAGVMVSLLGVVASAQAMVPKTVTVSEPSPLLLLGLGLLILGMLRRKK